MTGEDLYKKAQNGGKGFPPFEKLSPGQKGLWGNAARELQHEQEVAWSRGHRAELERVIAFLRRKCTELTEGMNPTDHIHVFMVGTAMADAANMLERGEHT